MKPASGCIRIITNRLLRHHFIFVDWLQTLTVVKTEFGAMKQRTLIAAKQRAHEEERGNTVHLFGTYHSVLLSEYGDQALPTASE
jgi:hypothetical protein